MAIGAEGQTRLVRSTATADEKRAALVESMRQEHAAVSARELDEPAAKARQARRLKHIEDVLAKYGEKLEPAAKAKK